MQRHIDDTETDMDEKLAFRLSAEMQGSSTAAYAGHG